MKITLEILYLVAILIAGMLMGYALSADGRNKDIHEFKVEAVMQECGHWNVNGEFDWNSPNMDDLKEIK